MISILMPVHNEEDNLDATIVSVLSQTHRAFRLLIINDGSDDGTLDVLERHASHDDRVCILTQSKAGISAALNRGLSVVNTEWLARIDAGDVALPRWLESQLAMLDAAPDAGLVFGRVVLSTKDGRPFYIFPLSLPRDTSASVLSDKSYPHPFVLARTACLRAAGGYPSADGIEDHLLWKQLARSGTPMIANPRVVGIQVRTPSHNDVVESRLSRRYDGLPDAAVQKVTLKALVERAVLYPFGSSGDTTKRRRALARRFPLTYLSACARALVMLLIARARLAFVLPAARGALERLHDTGKGMLH